MADFSVPIDALVQAASPEGGWGYAATQRPHPEPTCLACLALWADEGPHAALIEKGLASLEKHAVGDGTYRLDRGRPQATWPTAMVAFTKLTLGHDIAKSVQKLLELRSKTIKGDPEIGEMFDIDPERVGWPWSGETFAWVEPTAWATIVLRAAKQAAHPRVIEGAKMLLDRSFEDGGCNYGNRSVLGAKTEPIPGPTALMLLAMQNQPDPRIASAIRYLIDTVVPMNDVEHLAWAKLALSVQNDPICRDVLPKIDDRLKAAYLAQTSDGRPMSIARHALTALALASETRSPFRLTGDAAAIIPSSGAAVPPAKPQDPPKPGFIEGLKSRFRNIMISGLGAMRQPPVFGAVYIAKVEEYDETLLAALKAQYEHYRPHVPLKGKRIVLKPNLVEYRQAQVINTDPRFIDAVIQLCRDEGASEVIVAEGPGHWRNVEFLVEASGLGPVLRKHGVRFVDLNHDEPVKMPNLGRTTGLDHLYLTRTIVDSEVFISLPKLKTHHWAAVTLSLKNLFGTLPGICYGWPKNELHWRGIPNSIVDIALTHTPQLAIVDGIFGMEGDGPLAGKTRKSSVVVMGGDLVAVDATCSRLMGIPAYRVPTLVLGAQTKLGRLAEAEIEQIGETIESMKQAYEWPPKIERLLMPAK